MKNSKTRILSALLALAMLLSPMLFLSCEKPQDQRTKIVVTTFVLYDWVRVILGDDAENYKIDLLCANGADVHSYEPTVRDTRLILESDLFITVGGESDGWVEDILSVAQNDINLLPLCKKMQSSLCTTDHTHNTHEDGDEHESHYDEHIWLSTTHSISALSYICDALVGISPEKETAYRERHKAYKDELLSLFSEYRSAGENAKFRTVVCADRYPFHYLFSELSVSAVAAFDGCSAESEASFEVIKKLSDAIDKENLSSIIVTESSDKKIARSAIAQTKDKTQNILVLNSIQSINDADISSGVSYLNIMKENLNVIKTVLGQK